LTERLYEGLFLVDAAAAATDWAEIENQIRGLIEQQGATIEYSERWPEQRLAYPVNGIKRGVYFLAYFTSDTGAIAAIRNDGQLNENVLRMLVIQEDFLDLEMAKRKEAAARAAAVAVAKSEAKPEAESEAKPEAKSEAEPEAESEAKPEAESEAKPEAESEAEPEAESVPESASPVEDAMAASEGDTLDVVTPEAADAVDGEEPIKAEASEEPDSGAEVSDPEVVGEVVPTEGEDDAATDETVEEVANTEEVVNTEEETN
jgi:small subunit ribosomal protein S6